MADRVSVKENYSRTKDLKAGPERIRSGLAVDNTMTDLELIEACLTGDQECFSELVTRYKNLVYSVILRMTKDNEEANDLAQDVFLKIYKNLRSYSPEYRFSTWVIRISTNHVIDQHRKKRQETVPLDNCMHEIGPSNAEDSPETIYLRREQTLRINKIVADLFFVE